MTRGDDALIFGAIGTGEHFTPEAMMPERMPLKEPGKHRWLMTCGYTLSDSEVSAAHEGIRTDLGPDNLVMMGMGCVDCEIEYRDAAVGQCTAGDTWYPPKHPKHRP